MKNTYRMTMLVIQFSLSLSAVPLVFAQAPESFFPHHIGDRWDYVTNGSSWGPLILTRDSIGVDRSHNLMYNGATDPTYRIDTMLSVLWLPQVASLNYLYYKLGADSGNVWQNPQSPMLRWAWVARVDSEIVLGRRTLVKKYRYSPGHPDSGGANYYLEEHWLAQGFGLIYKWQEPFDVTYLRGCIIAGDTFGFVTSVQSLSTGFPEEFVLYQNYPNPFNPTTTISFSLPLKAFVSLKVFDGLGREVSILVSDELSAGRYSTQWNAAGLGSGVYFYRLQAGSFVETKKLMLLR